MQAFRRNFMFQYCEAITAAIRHPRTIGRLAGAALGRVHALAAAKTPSCAARSWPDYTFGCKRVLFSSHYLPALQRPNVERRDRADRARRRREGIVTADGTLHELDCIIWGTGFKTNDFMFPMQVAGVDGRRAARGVGRTARTRTSA